MPERDAHRENFSDTDNHHHPDHQTGNHGCFDDPDGPLYLRNYRLSNLAQQQGDPYHGGPDGVDVLTYDDFNRAVFKDIPQHVCDVPA